jgi:hypothetical protein
MLRETTLDAHGEVRFSRLSRSPLWRPVARCRYRRFIVFHDKRHPAEMGVQEATRGRSRGRVRRGLVVLFPVT